MCRPHAAPAHAHTSHTNLARRGDAIRVISGAGGAARQHAYVEAQRRLHAAADAGDEDARARASEGAFVTHYY